MEIKNKNLELLAEFPERNPNPVLEVQLSGPVTYANPASSNLLRSLGLDTAKPKLLLPADYVQKLQALDSQQDVPKMWNWEYEIGGRTLSCNGTLLGDRSACHLYLSDITDRRRAEAQVVERTSELNETRHQLLEKERLAAIGEFAAGIVHEIRNPLSTLTMALDYFNRTELPEAARRRAIVAGEEAARLQRLLSEILLYAKPQELVMKELSVDHLISDCVATFRELPVAQGHVLVAENKTDGETVLGDLDKLKQVFLNLFSNACEASTQEDRVLFKVDMLAKSKIRFAVINQGDPIPEPVLARICEPFLTTKPQGTGLGMAIVRRIVDAHQGSLEISSNSDKGTEVCVSLDRG